MTMIINVFVVIYVIKVKVKKKIFGKELIIRKILIILRLFNQKKKKHLYF